MRTPVLLVLTLVIAASAARADNAGVVVTGEASLQPQLVAAIEEWLRQRGHHVTPAPLPVDAINTMIDCFVIDEGGDGCARGVVDARSRAPSIVFTKVEVAPVAAGMRNIKLTAYWFQKGQEATVRARTCELCTEQSLATSIDLLMVDLAKSRQQGSGRLRVTSKPRGAKVLLNGHPIGITPLAHDLAPGNHELSVVLDQHDVETRPIAIRVGETTAIDVPLAESRDEDVSSPRRLRILPLALTGAGVIALAAGAYWIAIDEDDSPGGPLFIRDTGTKGALVTAAGGVAVAAGLFLLFRSHDAGPVASVSSSGSYIGWTGRF